MKALPSLCALLVFVLGGTLTAQEISSPGDEAQKTVCAALPETDRRQRDECKTEQERRHDRLAAREKPARTSFLQWLTIDGLWVQSSSSQSQLGIVGVHVAVANLGRVYFFGPPGVMLLRDRASDRILPAFTWGMGLHLADIRPPGMSRRAQVFATFAKCWTTGDRRSGTDMVGLSVSWKK